MHIYLRSNGLKFVGCNVYHINKDNAIQAKFNKNKDMTISEWIGKIVTYACPDYAYYYDIKQMQNVASDDCQFPAVFFEEYFGRELTYNYGWQATFHIELHWLNLVEMQGEAEEREQVRDDMLPDVLAFIEAFTAVIGKYPKDVQCDPEPPMFDANATGVLCRFTFTIPACYVFTDPYNTAEE